MKKTKATKHSRLLVHISKPLIGYGLPGRKNSEKVKNSSGKAGK